MRTPEEVAESIGAMTRLCNTHPAAMTYLLQGIRERDAEILKDVEDALRMIADNNRNTNGGYAGPSGSGDRGVWVSTRPLIDSDEAIRQVRAIFHHEPAVPEWFFPDAMDMGYRKKMWRAVCEHMELKK